MNDRSLAFSPSDDCPHTDVVMIPDAQYYTDDERPGAERAMCITCGQLSRRPITWQLRDSLTVRSW